MGAKKNTDMTSNLKSLIPNTMIRSLRCGPKQFEWEEPSMPDSPSKPGDFWKVRYNDAHEEVWPASKYAALCDALLAERAHMYPFVGDSRDYYILLKGAKAIKDTPGLVCEIGLRAGGGAKVIIDELLRSQKERIFISIDPYGEIPYSGMDEEEPLPNNDYTNDLKNDCLEKMYRYMKENPGINFLYFPLEDTEFFQRYADGVPVYMNKLKWYFNEYALVHFDGPHTTEVVLNEVEFFHPRTVIGSIFVFDDISHFYNHDKVEEVIFEKGWKLIEKTDVKGMYRRMK